MTLDCNNSLDKVHFHDAGEESEDEAYEPLPEAEAMLDPLMHAPVHSGGIIGSVAAVEVGSRSRRRLYEIRFVDGVSGYMRAEKSQRDVTR